MQPLGQLGLLPEQDAEILQAGPVIGQTAASHGVPARPSPASA